MKFLNRHTHKWKLILKTYTGGVGGVETKGFSASLEDYIKITHGMTSLLWECQICQKIRKEEMVGKEVKNDK